MHLKTIERWICSNGAIRVSAMSQVLSLRESAGPMEPLQCLGLERGASRATIRKRFLALSRRLHPDKCDHPRGREAFELVVQVFQELGE